MNVLTAGDLAGELAFLDSRPRYAALVALGPTKVFALQRSKLEGLLTQDPYLVYRVMRAITRFAHQVLHRSGAQIEELTAYIYKTKAKYQCAARCSDVALAERDHTLGVLLHFVPIATTACRS